MMMQLMALSPLLLLHSVHAHSCHLCPEGGSTKVPTRIIDWSDFQMTCLAAEEYARNINDETRCQNFIEDNQLVCQCSEQVVRTCTMCPNGGLASVASAECQGVYQGLAFAEYGTEECEGYQAIAQESCCNIYVTPPAASQNQCTLCAGGEEPVRNLMDIIYDDVTCNDLQASASVVSNSSDACYPLQLQGVQFCECPSDQLRKCNLCAQDAEAEPPFPDTVVSDDLTCADLHQSVAESNDMCSTIQAKGHFLCGCEKLPELEDGSCSLCFDVDDTFVNRIFANTTQYYCSDAAVDIFAMGDGTKDCLKHQAQAAIDCGCESLPPAPLEPTCTLCPGGFEPEFPDREIPDYNGLTCGKYDKLVPILFDGSNCNRQDLESYRNLCGCPEEAICRLCNSGDEIEDADLHTVDVNNVDRTCGELVQAAKHITLGASISGFQSQCQAYREFYSSDCCPGSSIEPLEFDFQTAAPTSTPLVRIVEAQGDSGSSSIATIFAVLAATSTLLILLR
jgi:hypothetical protein